MFASLGAAADDNKEAQDDAVFREIMLESLLLSGGVYDTVTMLMDYNALLTSANHPITPALLWVAVCAASNSRIPIEEMLRAENVTHTISRFSESLSYILEDICGEFPGSDKEMEECLQPLIDHGHINEYWQKHHEYWEKEDGARIKELLKRGLLVRLCGHCSSAVVVQAGLNFRLPCPTATPGKRTFMIPRVDISSNT